MVFRMVFVTARLSVQFSRTVTTLIDIVLLADLGSWGFVEDSGLAVG